MHSAFLSAMTVYLRIVVNSPPESQDAHGGFLRLEQDVAVKITSAGKRRKGVC